MSTRAVLAVGLAAAMLVAGVGPVVGVAGSAAYRASDEPVHRIGDEPVYRTGDVAAQYKVSLDNITVRTWLIRDSVVLNATVERMVIRNATTPDGRRTNVTLTNVTVGRFVLDRARLKNVTAEELVVRNKSVLNVPGGSLIDPKIANRTIERHWTKNQTVSGVVIDRIVVDAAILCGNATLGPSAPGNASFGPQAGQDKPDITVKNGSVGEALVIEGKATNWSVGGVERSNATNASLPKGCNRG